MTTPSSFSNVECNTTILPQLSLEALQDISGKVKAEIKRRGSDSSAARLRSWKRSQPGRKVRYWLKQDVSTWVGIVSIRDEGGNRFYAANSLDKGERSVKRELKEMLATEVLEKKDFYALRK